eukprot:1147917-Pelagomonas_calceolata.AAC.2
MCVCARSSVVVEGAPTEWRFGAQSWLGAQVHTFSATELSGGHILKDALPILEWTSTWCLGCLDWWDRVDDDDDYVGKRCRQTQLSIVFNVFVDTKEWVKPGTRPQHWGCHWRSLDLVIMKRSQFERIPEMHLQHCAIGGGNKERVRSGHMPTALCRWMW